MERQQRHRWIFTGINVIAIAVLLYVTSRFTSSPPKHVSYSEFLTTLRAGDLTDVQITERELIGVLKSDASHPKPTRELTIEATRLPGVDDSPLLKELEAHAVKFGGRIDQVSWVWSVLGWLFPLLFIVLIYGAGMRRIAQGSGPLTFGKNRAKIHDESTRMQVTFQDVAGVDEARASLDFHAWQVKITLGRMWSLPGRSGTGGTEWRSEQGFTGSPRHAPPDELGRMHRLAHFEYRTAVSSRSKNISTIQCLEIRATT